MNNRYTIKQAVEATGMEESIIRFYERTFREFLQFSRLGLDQNEFTEDHLDILRRIKQLVLDQGMSVDEVKRELKMALDARAAAAPSPATVIPIDDLAAQPQIAPKARQRHRARVISVTSGKGGVGKTNLTVNLAIAFAQMGKRVAIFDADLGLANVHILLGLRPRYNMRHVVEENFKLEDVVTEGPHGIRLISGGQGVREMANLTAEQRRVVLRQLDKFEEDVDILLVDTGAGISENVLRFASFADEIVVVTTPNILAAADGYSIIKILLDMEPGSKIGVIANQCENMYLSKNVFNRINSVALKHLGSELGDLGYVLADPKVQEANQLRRPLLMAFPDSAAARCIQDVAQTILHGEVFRNHKAKETSFSDLMGALKRTASGE